MESQVLFAVATVLMYGSIITIALSQGHPIEIAKLELHRSKKDSHKSKGFRGQHFKFLKKTQIRNLVVETSKKFFKRKHNFFPSQYKYIFELITDVSGSSKRNLYICSQIESYGKFSQIYYEWSCAEGTLDDAKSPENMLMQELVNKVENALAQAELNASMSDFKLAGSTIFTTSEFKPETVRFMLANACAATDDSSTSITFKTSLDGSKNPWLHMVDAYILIENGREFQVRFYSLERSIQGLNTWDFRCDWKGSLDGMLEPDSPEWQIVHALYAAIKEQFKDDGAKVFAPASQYERIQHIGLLEAWDIKAIEKACSIQIKFFAQKKKTIPLNTHIRMTILDTDSEGRIYLDRGFRRHNKNKEGKAINDKEANTGTQLVPRKMSDKRFWDLGGLISNIDFCIQLSPFPPKRGELTIGWTAINHKQESLSFEVASRFIDELHNRIESQLTRAGVIKSSLNKVLRIQFIEEIQANKKVIPQRGFWPTPQDYNEAAQLPEISFADLDLKCGLLSLNALGMPSAASGAFASVYKVSSGPKDWALRCFNSPVKDQLIRYEKTSKFICADDLPYTVPCHYLEEGIRVAGKWYPVVKMEWVDGSPLSTFIAEVRNDPEELESIRTRFAKMMSDLKQAGIAHGDLQHGNIIIRDKEFVLVDYDNMFVPGLEGFVSWETGHRNFQHPRRSGKHFGPYLDNFSSWIIDSALLCLQHDPDLWDRFGEGEENLLFSAADYLNPDDSELFQLLLNGENTELAQRASFIISLLKTDPVDIPALNP